MFQGILDFYEIWYVRDFEMVKKIYIQKSQNNDMSWDGGLLHLIPETFF